MVKGLKKGNVQPIKCHEGPGGEKRYSSTLSLISALDGVSGQRHAPTALTPVKRPGANYTGSRVEPKVGLDGYGLAPFGIRSPGRPARSESLYRHALQVHVKCKTQIEKEPAIPCLKYALAIRLVELRKSRKAWDRKAATEVDSNRGLPKYE
jgi:hypothetical protein